MENTQEAEYRPVQKSRVKRMWRISVAIVWYVFDRLMDSMEENWRIVRREADLFFGTLLTLLGVFGFHSGKYCDGNTADYLSCTRPTTFYYYGWLELFCIIMGTFFIILWFQKRDKK